MNNLDRFDRMLLGVTAPSSPLPASLHPIVLAGESGQPRSMTLRGPFSPTPAERQPVIHSTRGPKFVDYTACSLCGFERVGIEYHGVLMTGVKVHTIAAHTAGMGRVDRKQPRCLGSALRVVFEGGWKGAPA